MKRLAGGGVTLFHNDVYGLPYSEISIALCEQTNE